MNPPTNTFGLWLRPRHLPDGFPAFYEVIVSHAAQRAAKRCAAVKQVRKDPADFLAYVRQIAATHLCVWRVVQEAATRSGSPLTDEERAIIAQVVAPRLAGSNGQAERRHYRAKADPIYATNGGTA